MQIVSNGDNLHEMLNPFFSEGKNKKEKNKKNITNMSSAVFIQNNMRENVRKHTIGHEHPKKTRIVCACVQPDQNPPYPHKESLHHWLSKRDQ